MISQLKDFSARENLTYYRTGRDGVVREYVTWKSELDSPVPFSELFPTSFIVLEGEPLPGMPGLDLPVPLAFRHGELVAEIKQAEKRKLQNYPYPNDEELQRLFTLKQSIRDRILRSGSELTNMHDQILGVMKVWLHYTALELSSGTVPEFEIDVHDYKLFRAAMRRQNQGEGRRMQTVRTLADLKQRFGVMQVLYMEASTLAYRAATGYSSVSGEAWKEAIQDDVQAVSQVFETPEFLIAATLDGLAERVPAIRDAIDELVTLDAKRCTYDWLIYQSEKGQGSAHSLDDARIDDFKSKLMAYVPDQKRQSRDLLISRLERVAYYVLDEKMRFAENQVLFRKLEWDEYASSLREKEHNAQKTGANIKNFFLRHLKKSRIGSVRGNEDFALLARAFRECKEELRHL